ncbi:MAG: DUF6249 domain-containing protein [Burkholderiales bacterium]
MPVVIASLVRHRRIVLFGAVLLGIVAAGALRDPVVRDLPRDLPTVVVAGLVPDAVAAPGIRIRIAADDVDEPVDAEVAPGVRVQVAAAGDKATKGETADGAPAAAPKAGQKPGADVGISIDEDTGRVRISGAGTDREFESFEAFVQQAPWIAGVVFIVTFFTFLTPVLIVSLLIWYKVRKTRMLNETMIRLAEKGVVPAADALQAVSGGRPDAALQSSPATAPLYQQARAIRSRAAWSDLRKGIFCTAVGLGLTFYSMLDDGTPNFVGLVLLFVGLGFLLLWYLEDRQMSASPQPPAPPSPPVV